VTTISNARREVQRQVEEVFRLADRGEVARVGEVEQDVSKAVTALGRELMAIYFARQSSLVRDARYEVDGDAYELVGEEQVEVGTRFGKVAYCSKVGRKVGCARAARDRPLERQIGLSRRG